MKTGFVPLAWSLRCSYFRPSVSRDLQSKASGARKPRQPLTRPPAQLQPRPTAKRQGQHGSYSHLISARAKPEGGCDWLEMSKLSLMIGW